MVTHASASVLGALGVAALAVYVPFLWHWTEYFSTLVHEGGHALAALVTGNYVEALEIFAGGGGCTQVRVSGALSSGLVGLAGYAAPPAVGIGVVAGLQHGVNPRTMLLVAIFLVVILLLLARNTRAAVVVGLVLAGLAVLLHRAGPLSQTAAALIAAWFLVLSGLRDVFNLGRHVRAGSTGSDAHAMASLTGIPPMVWVVLFGAFAAFAIYLVARWLIGPV